MNRKKFDTRTLAKIAFLSAAAFLLMYLEFPLPFLPSFYQIDFSEVAVMIGGFAMGPWEAVAIEGMKVLLHVLFKGTTTAYVGDIANFLIGISFAVPAAVIYQKHKTKKKAIHGMIVGSISMIIVGAVLNYAVLLPAYSYFFGLPMDTLIGMGSALIPVIHDRLTFVLFATVPLNLIKSVSVTLLTMLLYKHISPLLHR